MTVFNNFLANLGFGTSDAQQAAQDNLKAAQASYGNLTPPELTEENPDLVQNVSAGPSEMGNISVNPADKEAQTAQLAALGSLAANGGRNAASDYNLSQIQGQEGAQAKGQRDAVMQNMQARGMGGSGADLIAQLSANQSAQSNANNQSMGVLANEANTALSAGQSAANIGSQMQSQDFGEQSAKAQAQDAINKFNTQNMNSNNQYNAQIGNQAQQYNTGLQQTGYQNQAQKAAGMAGSDMGAVNYNQSQANMGAQQAGGLLSGAIKLGASAAGGGGQAFGGKIGGAAPFKGNTTLNDVVPIQASPGEVVVPRTLVNSGTKSQIGSFVKNPPISTDPNKNKEEMLSALKNIRSRGMK